MIEFAIPSSFAEAEARLQTFAAEQGYPSALVWAFPEHASLFRRRLFVFNPPSSASRQRVMALYKAAVARGIPVRLLVLGHDGIRTCACFAPDQSNAGTHPSNPVFSLSASSPPRKVAFLDSRLIAHVVRLLGARNRYFTEFLFGHHVALVAFTTV